MDIAADLHVHTVASDGRLTLDELPAAARAGDVDVVAVTDHDTFHPRLDAPVSVREGLTVIHGLELRVDVSEPNLADDRTGSAAGMQVDLLGYGVRRTTALTDELDRLQRNRVERGAELIERVESYLGIDLDVEPRPGIGRPHVARAVDDSEADYDYQGAFDHLIGDDGPCFVAREVPTFETGVELLSEACSVVSLAHPFRYDDPEAALSLTRHLDAVERYYPYGFEVEEALVDEVVEREGLLTTGGSDAHGTELGVCGVPPKAFAEIRSRLPEAVA
ncbi:PHP domain-containing protein [Haloprofundus sp. MHR1]|uniref:PHP domain-containing protein n=1 Tax=Haloprofundus sp. MHR1 TaxID=2572921 RepID=UPI0010BE3B24|nr:PHP domain-containing protein [Haloprofundus sp. MHR1]QCJ46892.1 PHP domain-containing protein [Haloprofundus sp. MHR1]